MSSNNSGSGTDLPTGILIAAVVCSGVSTIISLVCIWLQLRNYRKVALQRWVVRILVMCVCSAIVGTSVELRGGQGTHLLHFILCFALLTGAAAFRSAGAL